MALCPKARRSFSDSLASVQLDLVRAAAAFLVLLSHWKVLFLLDYPEIPRHHSWFALPYILCDAGHEAVLIFFVLSGYLVGGSVLRSLDSGSFQWRTYLTHRLVRLWIVLIPGLLLCLLWDGIALHTGHRFHLLPNGDRHRIDLLASLSPRIFFGNLFFLQTILVPVFGSDSALWSLANEFWYYILFPLCLLALRRGPALRRVLSLVLLVAFCWMARIVLPLFPLWLAGAALALLPVPRIGSAARAVSAALYIPLVFVFIVLGRIHGLSDLSGLLLDYLFGALTALFLWTVLSAQQPATDSTAVRVIRRSAMFSYTLYVVHIPPLLLVSEMISGPIRWNPADLRHVALAVAILAAVVLYAFVIASFTEFRTVRVRGWFEQRLRLKEPTRYSPTEIVSAAR